MIWDVFNAFRKSCCGTTQVWDAGTQAGGWAGIEHQHTLHPARVPGLRPRAGQGLGLCWCALMAWVGWWFTRSTSLGTAGLGGDIGISGMVCAREGVGGCSLSYCAALWGHRGCRKLHVNLQYSDKLLWEKFLTCTILSPCPDFLYSCVMHGREQTVVINYHQIGVLHFHFPSLLKLVKDAAEPVWRGPRALGKAKAFKLSWVCVSPCSSGRWHQLTAETRVVLVEAPQWVSDRVLGRSSCKSTGKVLLAPKALIIFLSSEFPAFILQAERRAVAGLGGS